MLPAVWAPSPGYKEAKGVMANYVEALIRAAPPPGIVSLQKPRAERHSLRLCLRFRRRREKRERRIAY
jgi:hypothetical protein